MDDTPDHDRTRDEIAALTEGIAKLRATNLDIEAQLQATETAYSELVDGDIDPHQPPYDRDDCKIGGSAEDIADAIGAVMPVISDTLDFLRITCADPNQAPFDPMTGEVTGPRGTGPSQTLNDEMRAVEAEVLSEAKLGPGFDPDSPEWKTAGEIADRILGNEETPPA